MKILLAILINLLATYAVGQSRGYAGYIRIGMMSVPDAEKVLPQIVPGVSGFTQNFYGIGGELEFRSNKRVFDAEFMVLSHGPVNSGDSYAESFTGDVMFKAGYAVFNTRSVFIYPNAGIGLGGALVNTYQKAGGVKTQFHTIYLVQPAFDLGVNANVIVYRFKDETPTGILPVGLRAGYRFAASSDNWHRMTESGSSRASYSTRGWYLSIALGMGYISSNQTKRK